MGVRETANTPQMLPLTRVRGYSELHVHRGQTFEKIIMCIPEKSHQLQCSTINVETFIVYSQMFVFHFIMDLSSSMFCVQWTKPMLAILLISAFCIDCPCIAFRWCPHFVFIHNKCFYCGLRLQNILSWAHFSVQCPVITVFF